MNKTFSNHLDSVEAEDSGRRELQLMFLRSISAYGLIIAGCMSVSSTHTTAQDHLPNAKPVPTMQVIPLPYRQASVTRLGQEIARYHFSQALRRPFLYPIIGPSGRSLTRMGHPHDPNSHSHHNSVWISHFKVSGIDFWGDRGKGRIVHRLVQKYYDSDQLAIIEMLNDWVGESDEKILTERRRMEFHFLKRKQWLLVLDIQLDAIKDSITLEKTPFGVLGVRIAKTIGVHDGGGVIRNSQGEINEQGAFWKRARWVDYSGPITTTANEGITLLDHPDNPNHPSYFHLRDDGWMGASLTFDSPLVIKTGQPLHLRYGLYIHEGMPQIKDLNDFYGKFVNLPFSGNKKR